MSGIGSGIGRRELPEYKFKRSCFWDVENAVQTAANGLQPSEAVPDAALFATSAVVGSETSDCRRR